MNRAMTILMTDLRSLFAELGNDGGLVGPSVYDTARALRFTPPPQTAPVVEWLLSQQHLDGGWGDPFVPRARDLPTLAVVLALRSVASSWPQAERAAAAGEQFLREQAVHWRGPLPEDIPVGIELLLPALLEEANQSGLALSMAPYEELIKLGHKRRSLVARLELRPGSTPVHSWEALGLAPDPSLLDGSGSMGHSPAATAAWLHETAGRADLAAERAAAERYLERAAAATHLGIPGVLPTVWPITNFERTWAVYALQLAGMLDHPTVRMLVEPQIEALAQALTADGVGMTEWFATDGDITATVLAMLAGAGRRPDLAILKRFAAARPGTFSTYFGELQQSISATAHAAHALALLDGDPGPSVAFLLEYRSPDGTWSGDKWHASWLYLTSQVIAALCAAGHADRAAESLPALLRSQRADGAWGVRAPSIEDTTYAVLALLTLDNARMLTSEGEQALEVGVAALLDHYRPLAIEEENCWIGKELYRPPRVVRGFVLGTMLGGLAQARVRRAA
jgi:halimadienyl-diphosphate synthase